MPAKTLLPPPYLTLEDLNGATITGGTVTFLETGTAVLAVVYADANGLVISANPLTVDGAGRYTVFLTPGQVVDVEYRDANGTLVKTVPAVQAIPSASGNVDVPGTLGETVAPGQLVYLSDGTVATAGRWWLTDGSGQAAISTLGVALTGGTADTVATIRTAGRVTDLVGLVVGARYFTSATPGALALGPSARYYRVVGQADTTTSLVLDPNPFDTRIVVEGGALTGAVPQLILAYPGSQTFVASNSTLLTLQGIKAGFSGQRLRILAIDGPIDLAHQSPAAAPSDRLFNLVSSAPTSLVAGGVADYEYSVGSGGWLLIAHEQGGWITPPFNAADYIGNGGMTWTVAAGNVSRCAYYLRGKILDVELSLFNTIVGGPPSTGLQRAIPGGFLSDGGAVGPILAYNTAYVASGAQWQLAGNVMLFTQDISGGLLWAAVGGTHVLGTMSIPVQ